MVRQGSAKAPFGSSNLPVASKPLRRFAVVGAGAIGAFIAAALVRAGMDVVAVARGAQLEAMRRDGVHVESDLGNFSATVQAVADLREVAPPDVALLTFKAHQWAGALEQLAPLANGATTIVTLQNGLPFWFERARPLHSVDPGGRIASTFSDAQVVGGVVHSSAHLGAPGFVRQSGGMRFVFGEPGGGTGARVDALVDAFQMAGLQGEADGDIRARVWNKLTNNAGLNPVSALTRATTRGFLSNAGARDVVKALFDEATATGRACGLTVVDAGERLRHVDAMADVKTSMLQDLEAGRPLELDPILGAVVELAKRHDVAVPIAQTAYALTSLLARAPR